VDKFWKTLFSSTVFRPDPLFFLVFTIVYNFLFSLSTLCGKPARFLPFLPSSTAFQQSYPQYFALLIEKKTALVYNVLRLGNSALQFQETENDR